MNRINYNGLNFEDLPHDVIGEILSHLTDSPRDLEAFSAVDKKIRSLAVKNVIWNQVAHKIFSRGGFFPENMRTRSNILDYIKTITRNAMRDFPTISKLSNIFEQQDLIMENAKDIHYNEIKNFIMLGAKPSVEQLHKAAINRNKKLIELYLKFDVEINSDTLDVIITHCGPLFPLQLLLQKGALPSTNTIELAVDKGVSFANINLLLLAAIDAGIALCQTTIEKAKGYSIATNNLMKLMRDFHESPQDTTIKESLYDSIKTIRRFTPYIDDELSLKNLGLKNFLKERTQKDGHG